MQTLKKTYGELGGGNKSDGVTEEIVWWIRLLAYNTVGAFGSTDNVVSEFLNDMDEGLVDEKYRKQDPVIRLPKRLNI